MRNKPSDKPYCGVDQQTIKEAQPKLRANNKQHFVQFVIERYKIHLRKDVTKMLPPYTDNPILGQYRFTNVRREHDRQTRYLIDNISTNPNLTLQDKIINTFLFRAWNNWDTMSDFGGPWEAKEIYSPSLKERIRPVYQRILQDNPGRRWWSAAYNQGGTKAAWKFPSGDGYQKAYKEADAKQYEDWEADIPLRVFHIGPWLKQLKISPRLMLAKNQQEAYEIIKEVRGFSTFLAYQVFVDLTYIEEFPFSENEFVVAGPGCKKGLDLIFKDYDGMTLEEAIFWLAENFSTIAKSCDTEYSPSKLFSDLPNYDRSMNVMSIENCLCEISKYIRTINGTGRPKVRYTPKILGGLT